jgi:hypothetical protein
MKLLFLVLSLVASVAFSQEDKVNTDDPSMRLYQSAHTAGSVVDITGTYESQVSGFHGLPVDKSCPSCNLHGGLSMTDENGSIPTKGSSDGATEGSKGQGP